MTDPDPVASTKTRQAAARSKRAPAAKSAGQAKAEPKAHRAERKKRVAPAQDKLAAYGLDAICADIMNGMTLTAIAKAQGVSIAVLVTWIDADPERSARVTKARALTARLWDELATQQIEAAKSKLGLAKARELAHHYRWRASKISPREYGAQVDVTLGGNLRHTTDGDLDAIARDAVKDLAEATGQPIAELLATFGLQAAAEDDAAAT